MTTNEMRIEHLAKENKQQAQTISDLQGVVHQYELSESQLLDDVRTLQARCKNGNVEINQLQERCGTCGIGGG